MARRGNNSIVIIKIQSQLVQSRGNCLLNKQLMVEQATARTKAPSSIGSLFIIIIPVFGVVYGIHPLFGDPLPLSERFINNGIGSLASISAAAVAIVPTTPPQHRKTNWDQPFLSSLFALNPIIKKNNNVVNSVPSFFCPIIIRPWVLFVGNANQDDDYRHGKGRGRR